MTIRIWLILYYIFFMPKPSYPIGDYLIHGLKWIIEDHCGFRIFNKSDCQKLSTLITCKTQTSISANTLYRIFLHPNNTNIPYLHTLNILAKFVEFKNWDDFCKYYQELYDFKFLSGKILDNQEYKSLLNLNIYNHEFKSAYQFLEQFSGELSQHKKQLLGGEIYNILRFNPSSNVPFFKKFHNVSIVRETFFEFLADPDFNVPQYEFGLKCYLKTVNPEKSLRELQDFIFANSLIFRHYILTNQYKNAKFRGHMLYENHLYSADELDKIHVFPKFRYFAYYLFYRNLSLGFDYAYWDWFYQYTINKLEESTLIERRIILHTCYESLCFEPNIQHSFLLETMKKYPKNYEHFPQNPEFMHPENVLRLLDTNASTFFKGKVLFQ